MYTNILIPLDLSHKEQAERLGTIAQVLTAGQPAVIHLLYVDQSFVHRAGYPHLDDSAYQEHKATATEEMAGLIGNLPESVRVETHCRNGTAHDQIVEIATELGTDVVVMMAKKPGISSYFIGSNAERVVRHAPCSVFVIRDQDSDCT